MDRFDKIRTALFKYNAAIISGILWCSEWTYAKDGIIKEKGTPSFGHSFCWIGQKMIEGEPYLKAQLSNSKSIGDKGCFYFRRNIVNEMCKYGNFFFIDLTDEEIERLKNPSLWSRIVSYFKEIFI